MLNRCLNMTGNIL